MNISISPKGTEERHMRICTGGVVSLLINLVLVVFVSLAEAEEKKEFFTLRESIDEALAQSYRVRSRQERVDQASYVKNQARADFFPKLGTSYTYNRLSEVRTIFSPTFGMPIPVGTADNFTWQTSVTQPIFRGFALISNYRLAELGIGQSELELALEKLDLALQVKEGYFNILAADKAVEVAQKDIESRRSNAEVARNFYNVGMIPINDLLRAEVELANSEQNLVRAKSGAQSTRSAFNTVLVRPVNAPLMLEDILTYIPEKGVYEIYVENALNERPEIKILDVNMLQADQQIRLAKSKYYPEINLTWAYLKEGDDPSVSGDAFHTLDNTWQATAVASWTFWEWGKTYYAGREQESRKRQLAQTKLDVENGIRLEVKQALLDLEVAEKNVPTTIQAVEQAEENLRVNEERYKAQVTTITEVLDAQTLLTQARVNYYRALYDHNLAKARLERSLGTY
jgi:outer membrane protein TolC